MGNHASLRGLVVIGRYHQSGLRPHILGELHKAQCLDCVVGSCPCNNGHAPCGGFHNRLDHGLMFFMAQGRAFACGANRHKPVAAFGDLPVHEFFKRAEINSAVCERRYQCGHRAFEHDTLPFFVSGQMICLAVPT